MSRLGDGKLGNANLGGSFTNSRGLSSSITDKLDNDNVNLAYLLEFNFPSGKQRFSTAPFKLGNEGSALGDNGLGDVSLGSGGSSSSVSYDAGDGKILSLGAVDERTDLKATSLTIQLSAYDSTILDVALNDRYPGSDAFVYLAVLDSSKSIVDTEEKLFAGRVTQMRVKKSKSDPIVETKIADPFDNLSRVTPVYFSDQDQKDRFSGDDGLEFAGKTKEQMVNMQGTDFSISQDNRKVDIVKSGMGSILYDRPRRNRKVMDPHEALDSFLDKKLQPRNRIFGTARVENDVVFGDLAGNFLNLVMPVADANDGQITEVKKVGVNDTILYEDGNTKVTGVNVEIEKGGDSQSANGTLKGRSNVWTDSHRLRGIGYIYVAVEDNSGVIPQGNSKLWAVVKGHELDNPLTGKQEHTDNAGVILWNWLQDDMVGPGVGEKFLDKEKFKDLVRRSSTLIDTQDGTQFKRFAINANVQSDENKRKVLKKMLRQFAGYTTYSGGALQIPPPVRQSSTTKTINLDTDVVSDVDWDEHENIDKKVNLLRGNFPWSQSNDTSKDYVARNETEINNDGEERKGTLNLPYTRNAHRARYIAEKHLRKYAETAAGSYETSFMNLFEVTAGSRVELNDSFLELTNREALVTRNRMIMDKPFRMKHVLRGTSSNEFDFSFSTIDKSTKATSDTDATSELTTSTGGAAGDPLNAGQIERIENKRIALENDTETKRVQKEMSVPADHEIEVLELGVQEINDTAPRVGLTIFARDITNNTNITAKINQKFKTGSVNYDDPDSFTTAMIIENDSGDTVTASGFMVYRLIKEQ